MSYKQFTDEQILDALLKIRNYCEHTDDCRDCILRNPFKTSLCIFEMLPIPELIDDHTIESMCVNLNNKIQV